MKVIVDKMPETAKECPFAIHANDDFFPSICMLKHNNRREYTFAHHQYCNCQLCEGEQCDELLELCKEK